MPDADEFSGPIDYGSLWMWLALASIAVVLLWYVGVVLWSLGGGPKKARVDLPSARSRALGELDRIGHQVHSGELTERLGYQQMSSVVREFVSQTSGLPAHAMALADLRQAGVPHLAETIALMYPPEFAPEASGSEPLSLTLDRAKNVVATWN